MGNSSSSSRRRRNQHHHHHPHGQRNQQPHQAPYYPENGEMLGPCPHLSPYYYHHQQIHPQHLSPPAFQQGYYVHPGHFIAPAQAIIQQRYGSPAVVPPAAAPSAAAPALVPEYQKANTVRNDVNLNKGTLRLEKDEATPGHHVVAFSFDATAAGSICVFLLARETADGSVASISSIFPSPQRTHFKSGLGQKFKQELGLDFSLIDEQDLATAGPDNLFPLIIRIETVPKDLSPPNGQDLEELPGGPLRKSIHCQQTYAVITKKGEGEFGVKVVKQIIWVEGVRYELQEIYGIANGNEVSSNSSDSGKECVICMSEPKDTTVLPCRHMCMCSDCANVLRYKSNLCPICRCPVEELIQIKVPAD